MNDTQTKTRFQARGSDRPVRVAHVVFSLEPGGLENGIVNLANSLDRERFETKIYCLLRKGEFVDRLRDDVAVISFDKASGFSIRTINRLARQIRRDAPDLLHTHNLGPLIYGVGASFLSLRGLPILHGEHGVFREEEMSGRKLAIRRVLYRFCKNVHTVSASLLDFLVSLGLPSHHLKSILNGVDCDKFTPPKCKEAAKSFIGIPENAKIIGMVGRLIASKRHEMMLQAFTRIGERCPEAVLLIVGDGGEGRESVKALIAEHPFRNQIKWVGHQANPLPYYQAMDLLAMPSSKEGLSNALLEAMACGVPALAHPACGASEVIESGKNGILTEMEIDTDLVDATIGILNAPDRLSDMGKKARKHAEAEFSLQSMIHSYSELYESVAR